MQNFSFTPINESSILISFGDVIAEEVHTHVMQAKLFIETNPFPGFIETVPAYTSLAVYYNPVEVVKTNNTISATVIQTLSSLLNIVATDQHATTNSVIELPVCYDPDFVPDLIAIAEQLNLSTEELVSIHAGKTYKVYMLGFTPGFPYMGKIDERIFTQRKTQPRLKVEPGSVAIAGNQTGIYPFATPGGWNIIGRTPLQLFDRHRSNPFLLKAGDEVKFKPITKDEFENYKFSEAAGGRASINIITQPTNGKKQIIHIEQCGFLTTIQDTGRTKYQQFGVSKNGAMDMYAAQLANTLLDNDPTAAVLEITQSPHRFRFLQDALIAFTGGGLQPQLQQTSLPLFQPLFIPAGAIVECKQPLPGFRLYMAVAGGFEAEHFLGSSCTDLLMKAGGHEGRPLRKDDVLPQRKELSGLQKRLLTVLKAGASIEINHDHPTNYGSTIRVVQGIEWNYLDETSTQLFTQSTFTVAAQSSRMGYRLKETVLKTNRSCEIVSSAVTQGTIQLTPSGEMIVLMADAQTVGGYPRITQVCAADLSLLAQKKPGDTIQFQIVSLQEAEELYMQQANELSRIAGMLQSKL